MNMLMIVCPEARQMELRALMEKQGVHAYSELQNVIGEGKTGKKLGTHVWPAKSVLLFTVLPPEKKESLLKAMRDYQKTLFLDESLRAFVLPAEQAL